MSRILVVYAMAPGGARDSLVRTITQEGELSWEKCLAASDQKLLGEDECRSCPQAFTMST